MLSSKQRAYLRSQSNVLDAIFHIGKLGVTPELTEAIDSALEARELVKIDILGNCDMEPRDAAMMIHERTRSEVVQVIGKKFVLYRKSKTKPVIELPK